MFETINNLRTMRNTKILNDLLLIFIYLFSLIDLLLTYYAQYKINSIELNPLYYVGWWDLLVFFKLFMPFVIYIVSKKYNQIIYMYVLLMLTIWVCFWNTLVLLNTL